eukprot:5558576-Pleurochrysis_carterae.AAC.1
MGSRAAIRARATCPYSRNCRCPYCCMDIEGNDFGNAGHSEGISVSKCTIMQTSRSSQFPGNRNYA